MGTQTCGRGSACLCGVLSPLKAEACGALSGTRNRVVGFNRPVLEAYYAPGTAPGAKRNRWAVTELMVSWLSPHAWRVLSALLSCPTVTLKRERVDERGRGGGERVHECGVG